MSTTAIEAHTHTHTTPAAHQLPLSAAAAAQTSTMQPSHSHSQPGPAMSSFEGRAGSFSSQPPSHSQPVVYQQQPSSQGYQSYSQSFGGRVNGHSAPAPVMDSSQIYTAVYSGVSVYEMEVNGVAVMRRRSDSWLNATQILKVAGVDKGKRTKVLEKEILSGEHEKVQGGYGKYQGTWINYRRGREFCRQYGVEELLRPLLDYDISTDGSGQPGQGIETPTKEQAMAANRKRFYTQTVDGRGGAAGAGTFFQNISSTASNALAAMNKAARYNSPAPRPGSAAHGRPNLMPPRNSQQSMLGSQESFRSNSQQSVPQLGREPSFSAASDSAYATQHPQMDGPLDSQEPPRKRIKQMSPEKSFSQRNGNVDTITREGTPTEAGESFIYHQAASQGPLVDGEVPSALPPLPHPGDQTQEAKQALILDLFTDSNNADFSHHPAIKQLSGADLDLPLDQSANTALHWAATLARVPLMRLLISRGASIFRGNIAGETPLMAAVQVNNNLDHSSFPELLEILAPLIEVRDAKQRTILHHIAVACGIKGRAASSKYYLEALLEFLVRNQAAAASAGAAHRTIGLMRFMSEMVNARDISGNTALNLVSRIGNRSIIQQLIEVQADPTIANYKGLRPLDFGITGDGEITSSQLGSSSQAQGGQNALESPGKASRNSRTDELAREVVPSITSALSETARQFDAEIRILQDKIDTHTSSIRDISTQQQALSAQVEGIQARKRARDERRQKIENLRRAVAEMRASRSHHKSNGSRSNINARLGDADAEFGATGTMSELQARVTAYASLNGRLSEYLTGLRRRDGELEAKYRRVIALCTGAEEEKVDAVLGQLVLAVESEGEGAGGQDVGRVREFLRRVEMVI